ncbi:MT-A70 family methyltransferase [Rhizobium sp. CNPSo 4062]|uniref:Spo0J and IME4 domain-containing protein n=1 Tax=Rhizobium sp. CNPSo 4062 TaxID=3021410 RepID=UPI00255084C1|nr:MT-A70 family methyltransferase [Rhizobium sp. CNPSo 4062]MDK4704312.1 MT-A70 family methyltransferase [Rhizobium sp. CNPSo 4062]
MNTVKTAQERVAAMMGAALRDGQVRSADHNERKTCIKLNVKGMLRRDSKDADLWYPTEAGAKKYQPLSAPKAEDSYGSRYELPRYPDRIPHHALAGLFPMFSEAELDELAEDIRMRGQEQPVWILDGKIIDGRNRDEACHRIGIDPWTKDYEGDDPLGFVLSLNLRRRHLTESQRAMVAAKIVDWERGMNQATAGSANLPTREAARRMSISERAVTAAKRVREQGAPALLAAIEAGKITVNAGESLSYLERQAQEEVLRAEKKEIIAKAKAIRTERQQHSRMIRTALINHIADKGERATGEMPRAAYAVGYCDVPWQQEAWSDETGQDKGLPYPSMTVDELMSLCAGERSPFTQDAILYFWTTTNRLADALRIIGAWGFSYVSMITWDKVNIGMGRWVRDRTEHLIICKRGNFPGIDLYTAKPESLYSEVKTEHSRKPVWFSEEIERLYPDMRKLELFQRKESLQAGDIRLNGKWDFWGNQAGAPEGEAA